jgi:tol-pal system protein YbgF
MLVFHRPLCSGVDLAVRGLLVAVLGLAACAHRPETPTTTAPAPDDARGRQARENAALRRRIEMLEDRVLHLEQTGDGATSLPDGRVLPIVRLDAPATSPPRHAQQAARAEPEPEPAPEPAGMRPRSRGTTLARVPDPVAEAWAVPEEPVSLQPVAPPSAAAGPEPKRYRLVGARLVELTQAGGPKAPDRAPVGKKARGVVAEYEAAMAVYHAGAYGDAESAFEAFARAHPRHDYADNALYWKGEAAYDQAHYADALAAFTEVVERYGGGNKAADALLKIGLCYRELGDDPNARDVLSQLIDAYPGERASDIARVKLAEFGI